jgi:hypothetical protein
MNILIWWQYIKVSGNCQFNTYIYWLEYSCAYHSLKTCQVQNPGGKCWPNEALPNCLRIHGQTKEYLAHNQDYFSCRSVEIWFSLWFELVNIGNDVKQLPVHSSNQSSRNGALWTGSCQWTNRTALFQGSFLSADSYGKFMLPTKSCMYRKSHRLMPQ